MSHRVEDIPTKTLDALHTQLRKHNLISEGLGSHLKAYWEERNWLVHQLYTESWEDQYSPIKAPKLAQRIAAVGEEAKGLTRLFDQLNDQWMQQNGHTATLQAHTEKRLHEIARAASPRIREEGYGIKDKG